MRNLTGDEIARLRPLQDAARDAIKAANEAIDLYTQHVTAMQVACKVPPQTHLLDRDEAGWLWARVVGQAPDGRPVTEPLIKVDAKATGAGKKVAVKKLAAR